MIFCKNKTTDSKGFTLVEMVVTIAIFGVTVVTLFSVIAYTLRTNRDSLSRAAAIDSARRGMQEMITNIREASYGANGNYIIEDFQPYRFEFYGDIDLDAQVEKIIYSINGNVLEKTVVEPVGSPVVYDDLTGAVDFVVQGVENQTEGVPLFTYYDNAGSAVTNPANLLDIERVDIELVFYPVSNSTDTFTIQSSAGLRNAFD